MDPRIRAGMWECLQRVGERIAEAAFREHPAGDATHATLAGIAALFLPQAEEFIAGLGGDEADKHIARFVLMKSMRARYDALSATADKSRELVST